MSVACAAGTVAGAAGCDSTLCPMIDPLDFTYRDYMANIIRLVTICVPSVVGGLGLLCCCCSCCAAYYGC